MPEFLSGPGFLSARSTLASDISYLFAVAFSVLFVIAGYLAHKKKGFYHHRLILVSMLSMLCYFFYYYEIRNLGLESFADQINFPGPQSVYQNIFRPAMMVHFLAVTLSIFFSVYMIVNGFTTAQRENGTMSLKNQTIKPSRLAWIVGFFWLGFLSWWVFSHPGFGWGHQLMFLTIGYFLPASLTLGLGRLLPDSERRHRVLGRFTIGMFLLLLLTSSLVYYLLYLAY